MTFFILQLASGAVFVKGLGRLTGIFGDAIFLFMLKEFLGHELLYSLQNYS